MIGVVVGPKAQQNPLQPNAMRELLFNVEPADPVTFIAMPVLLAAVALVACVVPARR